MKQQSEAGDVRVIKRYANRKLYDLKDSSYVTLDEIAQFVKKGEEIQVIDNKTKEDLTALTLTQIIFEKEKRKKRVLPLSTLRGVIQSGGEFIQRRIAEPVKTAREEAEKTVVSMRDEAERAMARLVKFEGMDDLTEPVRDLIDNTHALYDHFQKRLDETMRVVLGGLPQIAALKKEVDVLKKKVSALEQRSKKDS